METYQVGLIALAIFALMVWLAYRSWQKKELMQSSKIVAPNFIDFRDAGISGFYVATTFVNRPLDRILAHGMGHRGRANFAITNDQLEVLRLGEPSFAIPLTQITEIATSSAVIDRAVEKGGLSVVTWRLGEDLVDSYFRLVGDYERGAFQRQLAEATGVGNG